MHAWVNTTLGVTVSGARFAVWYLQGVIGVEGLRVSLGARRVHAGFKTVDTRLKAGKAHAVLWERSCSMFC